MSNIISVDFHNDTLALVEHNGQPFVAMKSVVENMGLDWGTQFRKLNERYHSTIVMMTRVAEDGKNREMLCLPMRKITSWLYSINPKKVKPELHDKVIQYQEECDDVLWQYWTKGYAGRAQTAPPSITQQISANKERGRLLKELRREDHREMRLALYQQVEHLSNIMGVDRPDLEKICPTPKNKSKEDPNDTHLKAIPKDTGQIVPST